MNDNMQSNGVDINLTDMEERFPNGPKESKIKYCESPFKEDPENIDYDQFHLTLNHSEFVEYDNETWEDKKNNCNHVERISIKVKDKSFDLHVGREYYITQKITGQGYLHKMCSLDISVIEIIKNDVVFYDSRGLEDGWPCIKFQFKDILNIEIL